MAAASVPVDPAWSTPLDHEWTLLTQWRRRAARAYMAAVVILVLAIVSLAGWALTDPAFRGLLVGDASPVVASVTDVERIGACVSRTTRVDRYRYDVVVTDAGKSGLDVGSSQVVEECRLHRTGAELDLTAVGGRLTDKDPRWARSLAGVTILGALFVAGLLWFFRREGVRVDRLVAGEGRSIALRARLVSARFGWFADTGVEVIPLGLPLITPDQQLLVWRFRRVPLRDGCEVGLLLLGKPQSGDPVLLVDDAGVRQWRTLR